MNDSGVPTERRGRTMRPAILLFSVLVLLAAAPAANAATTVGQVLASPNTANSCSQYNHATMWPSATIDPSVPTDGIITGWSHAAKTTVASTAVELILWRHDTGNNWKIQGHSTPQTIPMGTTGTFPTRIAVKAGDLIGIYVDEGGLAPCYGAGVAGDKVTFGTLPDWALPLADDGVNVLVSIGGISLTGNRPDIAAAVEPDADADGYGDETQDLCATDATIQTACPTPGGGDNGGGGGGGDNGGSGGGGGGGGTTTTTTTTTAAATTPVTTPVTTSKAAESTQPLAKSPVLSEVTLKASPGGTAATTFSLPAGGKLTWKGVSGKTVVVSGSKTVKKKGKAPVSLKLNAAGKKLVKKKGKLTVKVTFTWWPAGGKPQTSTKTVTFKK